MAMTCPISLTRLTTLLPAAQPHRWLTFVWIKNAPTMLRVFQGRRDVDRVVRRSLAGGGVRAVVERQNDRDRLERILRAGIERIGGG
jgi:hypothetical protein